MAVVNASALSLTPIGLNKPQSSYSHFPYICSTTIHSQSQIRRKRGLVVSCISFSKENTSSKKIRQTQLFSFSPLPFMLLPAALPGAPIGGLRCTKAAAQNLPLRGNDDANENETYNKTLPQIKQDLISSLQDINRGIFGVPSEKRDEIQKLVELLESHNPNPQPTLCLEKVGGAWKLIYSTITILGSKRTKLGLRDFINLGDFIQYISVAEGKAVNVIQFTARGLSMLSGQLTIDASFNIASHSRVDITYNKSAITPEQLMNVFRKNYDLLLGIFNPQGWLEITFVDDVLRVGRDDKGNIFILQRVVEEDMRSS